MLASAYQNGQIAGELTVYALLIAGGVALIHRLRGRRSRAVSVAGVVLMSVVALVSVTGRGPGAPEPAARSTSDAAYLAQSRRDMIAGCTDKGAQRSYCECFADQMLERAGHDATRLRAMVAEVQDMGPGGQPPAVLAQAGEACANPA